MSTKFEKNRRLLMGAVKWCLLLSVLLLPSVGAQSGQPNSPPDNYPYAKFSPSLAIIIVVLVAALFFMGCFSIYIRRCSSNGGASLRQALSMRSTRRTAAASRGLDAAVIETFPTFAYSTVKGLKIGKGALECAVCLNEFEDEETLRLIPQCHHVFHPECIDAWLESHVTCPVCRANLAVDNSDLPNNTTVENQDQPNANDDVSIPINEVNNNLQDAPQPEEMVSRNPSLKQNRSRSIRPGLFGKFRSNSTGHSLSVVQPGENTDRYTLRLPEEVRKQVMSRVPLNRTASSVVVMPRESSVRKGYRTGEGSSRGRSYRRMESLDWVVRSDRWVFSRAPSFLTRAFSMRSPRVVVNNGESSTTPKGSKAVDKIPLHNVGPKSDETGGSVADDSARLPV